MTMMLRCFKCKTNKPEDHFNRGSNPYLRSCRACRAEFYSRDRYVPPTHKACTRCKEDKPIEEFRKIYTKTSYYSMCIVCEKKREKVLAERARSVK